MILWDCFIYVCYWVNYFNSQIKRLEYSSIHLYQMVKEFFVPLLEGIKLRVNRSWLFLIHVISLGLPFLGLINSNVILSNEGSFGETLHEQWFAKDVLVTLVGSCYACNCKKELQLLT